MPEGPSTEANALRQSLAELRAQLDGLEKLMLERDRRYEDRFKGQETAVQAALAAQEKFNSAVSAASKEAILKAEASQIGVNERSNEFRGQLADQAATLMPRKESETAVGSLRELFDREINVIRSDIKSLRESRSEDSGEKVGRFSQQQFVVMLISIIGSLLGIGGVVVAIAYAIRK